MLRELVNFCRIGIVDYFCGTKSPPSLKLRRAKRGVAQLASALAWGARGRLFESDHPDRIRRNPVNRMKAVFLGAVG